MRKGRSWVWTVLMIIPLLLAGCGDYGKVDQGRVIAADSAKRQCTLIQDLRAEPGNPDYRSLPPHTYTYPTDPHEMGPEPKAGLRMNMDTKARKITIFDPATQDLKDLDYTLIDQKDNVGKDSPLVYDSAEKKPKKFPVVDKEKKTITVYSSRQRVLVTFSLPDEYFNLPENTWEAGDEVRVYYREPGKAIRFMNISRTDIFKK